MLGTDATSNIIPYINNNDTVVNLKFEYQGYNSKPNSRYTNPVRGVILNYTSPCDTFSTTVTSDTTICQGEQLQLNATGGVATGSSTGYEWTSLKDSAAIADLSCTDCPNPIFSGDSSQVYTVRVWNTDSCSVVKPVRINVSQPEKLNFSTGEADCGIENGYIKSMNLPENMAYWHLISPTNDTLNQPIGNTFSNLGAGDYEVYYVDTFGCKSQDTTATIETKDYIISSFIVDPVSGGAPLSVQIENQSQYATNYEWLFNGISNGTTPPSTLNDNGIYEIGLIAWATDKSCADTSYKKVLVFDSLVVTLPNVFTPNNDGVNDFFNVKINLPVRYDLSILNRWGNVVYQNEASLQKGTHDLWNGKAQNGEIVTDGTYFYRISFELDKDAVDCEVADCEVSKEGFVEVRK